jgi:type IV pilus assembly protein PilE
MQDVYPSGKGSHALTVSNGGFTLIEVMIVVAIIGILSAIAMPLYSQYVQNARRAEARAMLMENAQYMQRFYTQNGSYAKTLDNNAPALPNTANTYYDFSNDTANLSTTTYTLQAVPKGTMSTDKCGTLTLTNTGVRGSSKLTAAECWK